MELTSSSMDKCRQVMHTTDRVPKPSTVELAQMRQQTEVRGREDDWTGLNDAATRRKLQNRLNQRIYRRRRRAKVELPESESNRSPSVTRIPSIPRLSGIFQGCAAPTSVTDVQGEDDGLENAIGSQPCSPGAVATKKGLTRYASRFMGQAQMMQTLVKIEHAARRDYTLGSPRVDQMLTLIQFNVFRALLSNTIAMGWNFEWLECDDPVSPWYTCPIGSEPICPNALRPTLVQRTIVHHPWIDIWPIPKMRDNLLLAGDSYDEDQLCNDLVEFVDVSNERTGLIVWSEPWDPSGWEVSETFLRKWGWTVKGCVALLQSTNDWRTRRGERPLNFEL